MRNLDKREAAPDGVPASQVAKFTADELGITPLVVRSTFGGILMGLANLVPGISGGTMLLAAGIYPRFVDAVAELTRFRFRYRSLLVLGCVVLAAVLGILLLAGTLKDLVLEHRWVMYSLFIGLTLGGIPIVWKMARPASASLLLSAMTTFLMMIGVALLQAYEVVGNSDSGVVTLFLAGLAGASAMILPGLSGGYLLLLMGQYVPILSAIDAFKNALKDRDIASALEPAFTVMLPVGVGVVLGVALVGNLLQWLLHHYRKPTLGGLLGLLIGSTAGLWPFQVGVPPTIGELIKGQVVTEATLSEIDEEDWKVRYFAPTNTQIGVSMALVLVGFATTIGVSKLGGHKQ